MLRAFARIQARYPDATLTLVGSGSQEAALHAEAAALQLDNVTFAGRVAPSEIQRYYASADIYVQAPSIDNMPLSVLEAFASGMPVVSTDVGGVPSLLRHGMDGLLVADNDDAAMAAQVSRLLADPSFARQLAGSAHHTLAAYEWPVVREGGCMRIGSAAGHRRERLAHATVSQPHRQIPHDPEPPAARVGEMTLRGIPLADARAGAHRCRSRAQPTSNARLGPARHRGRPRAIRA